MRYVGKVLEMGNTAIKEYVQTSNGSAWKKVGTDIIMMKSEGFDYIIIRINPDHPYRVEMEDVIRQVSKLIPDVTLELLEEV